MSCRESYGSSTGAAGALSLRWWCLWWRDAGDLSRCLWRSERFGETDLGSLLLSRSLSPLSAMIGDNSKVCPSARNGFVYLCQIAASKSILCDVKTDQSYTKLALGVGALTRLGKYISRPNSMSGTSSLRGISN